MSAVLLADDDASIRTVITQALKYAGHDVMATGDGAALLDWALAGRGAAAILDVCMPVPTGFENGLDLLSELRRIRPDMPVIIISAQSTLITAVQASARGAFEYFPKPFDLDAITDGINRALMTRAAMPAKPAEASTLSHPAIIGTSPAMQEVYRTIARIVPLDLTVMIQGESGTGKELVARALHDMGPRASRPFVALNMAAIPKELVESELFGHEKGAFTGATDRKVGKFELAGGGTLFLDEIGDMPLEAQTRLLRVLQQGEFVAVGGTRVMRADVRVICATHRDLSELVRMGRFREDLYYRLNVVPVHLPPLRERRADIPMLAAHFLAQAVSRGLPRRQFSPEAVMMLSTHAWPGNIRELENTVYRLCALCPSDVIHETAVRSQLPKSGKSAQDTESLETLVSRYLAAYFAAHAESLPPAGLYDRILPLLERPLIIHALHACQGNQLKASALLGINRNTLRKKMRELGIETGKVAA